MHRNTAIKYETPQMAFREHENGSGEYETRHFIVL